MTWFTIVGMILITFFNRYVFFAEAVRYTPSAKVKRFLSYSSFAVLTAIWTPIIFSINTESGFGHAGYDYLIAGVLAALMSFFRAPSILVVLVSAAVFFGIRFML